MVKELKQHMESFEFLKKVLVLGLGGGALCTYIHQEFKTLSVVGVEIDPTMVLFLQQRSFIVF
jgi:spermidine synthase